MKHFTKLSLLALLIVFASCQNESVQEDAPEQALLRFKDGQVVSDGEEDKELMFDGESEILRSSKDSFSAKTNNCTPDLLDTGLNSSVNIDVINKPGTGGYFDISVDGGEIIQAYCADQQPSLGANDDGLDFSVVSTYDDGQLQGSGQFASVFANPQNFDKVNWMLNNVDISEGSEYTYGHVQYAIWKLIEGADNFVNDFPLYLTNPTNNWNSDDIIKAEEIYDMAIANGEGFEPGCGDMLGLVLIPANFDVVQSILISREIPDEEDCETTTLTDGDCTGCDASMSVTYSCDCQCVEVSACKDLSNIVLLTADGTEVKYEDLEGQTANLCSPDGSPIVSVWVKAGCFRSGDGPGYGRRFDNPNPDCSVPEEECEDCLGKVTDLTLNWDWHNDYRVKVYQRRGNTRYARKIFDQVVGPNEDFTIEGANSNGTFGKWVYIFVGNCYYTKIKTNCHLNIGPGYRRGVIEVVSGQSSLGGELCEYEPPHNWCWWW